MTIEQMEINTGYGPQTLFEVHCSKCHARGPWKQSREAARQAWADRPEWAPRDPSYHVEQVRPKKLMLAKLYLEVEPEAEQLPMQQPVLEQSTQESPLEAAIRRLPTRAADILR